MRANNLKKRITIILLAVFFISFYGYGDQTIPVTGSISAGFPINNDSFSGYGTRDAEKSLELSISQFVDSVSDGQSSAVRGIYATDIFALKVVQQPSSNAGFVSSTSETATQFSLAKNYNTIGMLAHNYLAGQYFFDLTMGNIIQVVYGDGHIELYKVAEIYRYQALSPDSASSQFVDLESDAKYSASEVFYQMYSGPEHLTLQTCIQNGDEDSWGRLFILAYPL